jgi:hypothetical protein
MEIEFVRMLLNCHGAVMIITLLVIMGVALSLNKRLKKVTTGASEVVKKVQGAADDLQVITSYTRKEVATPLVQLAGIIQGLNQGIQSFSQMFKK